MADFEANHPRAFLALQHPGQQEDVGDAGGEACRPDPAAAQWAGWVAAIASGNSEALGLFYDATLARCYALALRIARDAHAAEDICGDVYMQVWRDAASFDPGRGRVLAWLMTICRSRALDHLRRRKMEEVRDDVETLLPCGEEEDPLDLIQALEVSSLLAEALRRLSPVQRQVISLAFYRGMTQQEIADHIRVPLGTIKSYMRRALTALRTAVQPHFD